MVLVTAFAALTGCGLFQEFDGSTDQEIDLFYGKKQDAASQIERDILVNTLMKEQEDRMREELEQKRVREELLATMPDKIAQMASSITVLKKEIHDLKAGTGLQAQAASQSDIAAPLSTPPATPPVTVADLGVPPLLLEPLVKAPSEVNIKVLSGTGIMVSAKKMSERLKQMGYKVGRIDIAPYTFSETTVFFSEGNKPDAEKLVKDLGTKAAVKPLTWKSIFQLIVVTGP